MLSRGILACSISNPGRRAFCQTAFLARKMSHGEEEDLKRAAKRRLLPHEYNKRVESGRKRAFFKSKKADRFDDDEWKNPSHPADVKRDYVLESQKARGKWIRTKVQMRADPPEQKYKSFQLILGTVHRRIAKNRVEVLVRDAEFNAVTLGFYHEQALVVVKDSGKTRIGDYISATLTNKDGEIFTHALREIVRASGHVKCPITGQLIRDNQLVDPSDEANDGEDIFDRQYIEQMHETHLDRRIHNYKYRDEFNRDLVSYELRWDKADLARSGREINSSERKETFKTVKSKRSHRIDQLRKQLDAAPKTPNVTEIE